MSTLDQYIPYADQPTPKPQEGEWTLIAPDGRKFTGPSPMRCVHAETKTRVPPHVALGRIARGMQEPLDEALRPNEQKPWTEKESAKLVALQKESAQEKSVQPADERQAWIAVEERLPPGHQDFIALNRDGRIFRSRMCYGMHAPWFTYPQGDKSPSDTMPDWIDVTHWMPLPDAARAAIAPTKEK